MKTASTLEAPPETPEFAPARRLFPGWTNFWFSAVAPAGLHNVRFLAGVLFICWLLPLHGHVEAFFGLHGWFDTVAYKEANALQNAPPETSGWSLLYILNSATALKAAYWATLGVFLLFALGVAVRVTAVLSWLMLVSFLASPAVSYDADYLLGIFAFYLMIGYVLFGQWNRRPSDVDTPFRNKSALWKYVRIGLQRIIGPSDVGLLGWFRGARSEQAPVLSYAANLTLRLLQVHFAIVVVTSGLHKLQFGDWWSGVAFWYPMHPPFETTAETIQKEAGAQGIESRLFFMSSAEYLVLAWQIGFPLFAWRKGWRVVLLGGAVIGWLGCIFLYRLPLFGPIYLLGCLCYLTPEEWLGMRRLWGNVGARAPAGTGHTARFQPRVQRA